jgi:hypothetical protein
MAQQNPDGTVTMRTRGALAYTPSGGGGFAAPKPASARKIGGGGYAQSGRNTLPKGTSTSSRSGW